MGCSLSIDLLSMTSLQSCYSLLARLDDCSFVLPLKVPWVTKTTDVTVGLLLLLTEIPSPPGRRGIRLTNELQVPVTIQPLLESYTSGSGYGLHSPAYHLLFRGVNVVMHGAQDKE